MTAEKIKTKHTPGPARTTKERVTFYLPVELIEKARDVVFWSPGLTVASLMEEALGIQLERVERKRGEPFPSRAGAALKTGRPVMARAQVLAAEASEEERKRVFRKERDTRTWAWNAIYHRAEIKRAQKSIEYHTAKLNVASLKAKEDKTALALSRRSEG